MIHATYMIYSNFSAYFTVCSSAVFLNRLFSLTYCWATSGRSGCSGSGQLTSANNASKTVAIRVDGFQFELSIIGRQICPFSSIFGWQILVRNVILGGLNGYSVGKTISIRNAPFLYGAESGIKTPSILFIFVSSILMFLKKLRFSSLSSFCNRRFTTDAIIIITTTKMAAFVYVSLRYIARFSRGNSKMLFFIAKNFIE